MRISIVLLIGLSILGCGNPPTATTPAAVQPNSPQTQAHNINKTLADSINAAVKTAIAARDQGKLSQANTLLIENWARPATVISDKIEMELQSADAWAVQKQKILALLTTFQLPSAGTIETTVQAALAAVGTLLTQLRTQVAQ